MERKVTRVKGSRYCTLEIRLSEEGELSVRGETGRVMRKKAAKQEAIAHWVSYFEENPAEREAMGRKFGRTFRTDGSAARFVVDTDGDYHGLDAREVGEQVFCTEACGQITDELREWFPEAIPLLPWHLNHMRAECAHQRARGETWTKLERQRAMYAKGKAPAALGVCPDCGYALGSAWLREELPPEIVALAESVAS